MPRQPTITEVRLNNISNLKCVAITATTLDVLVNNLKIVGLEAILNTTQSLLELVQTVKQDKNECTELMEQTHQLLGAIIGVYIKSDTGFELPPSMLNQIAKFTETFHKIHTYVEAQQSGSKVKKFFRRGELNALLRGCKEGLQQGLNFFQREIRRERPGARGGKHLPYIEGGGGGGVQPRLKFFYRPTFRVSNPDPPLAQTKHQEVLDIIEVMSNSDSASLISKMYSGSYASSNSVSMLPAEPKIFHGRDSELAAILKLFKQDTPRIAILGAGGMGKTSLARIVLHHEEITTKYHGNWFFITCDTVANNVELAGLIGVHLGMKPSKDLTQAVIKHFCDAPPSLLILDNLETAWEPITMRGAERPAKVQWSRPFLLPLQPLAQDAARKMFIDIVDERHSLDEIDQVLSLTDNMPLSINLLAHLVDIEGCTEILSRWDTEKTSLISEGHDRRSNLELSISLSLSSPRIASMPYSQDLLALLSILPDGLSDVELKQSKFPIKDILGCKIALLRTALVYTDDRKCIKVLVPIREYMGRLFPPTDQMIQLLLKHFHELLESYGATVGTRSGMAPIDRITSNYTNIQNILQTSLHREYHNVVDVIYCICDFNWVSLCIGHGATTLLEDITNLLPSLEDHRLKVYLITELVQSWRNHPISHPELLIIEALNHFKDFDDPDLEGSYYFQHNHKISAALQHGQIALSLAKANRNLRGQCEALHTLGELGTFAGDHTAALAYAQEEQMLANICGDLWKEACGLYIEAISLQFLDRDTKDEASQVIFRASNNAMLDTACETIQADLNFREGDMSSLTFGKCLKLGWGMYSELISIVGRDLIIRPLGLLFFSHIP
ncbi:hypothetical protein C8F04DRAFT_1236224, partial [Mycena alexandri]